MPAQTLGYGAHLCISLSFSLSLFLFLSFSLSLSLFLSLSFSLPLSLSLGVGLNQKRHRVCSQSVYCLDTEFGNTGLTEPVYFKEENKMNKDIYAHVYHFCNLSVTILQDYIISVR